MAAVFGLAHVELRPLGFGQASAVIGSDEQDVGAAVIFGPVLNEAKYLSSFDLISYLVRSRVANAAGNEHTGSHHNAEEAHWCLWRMLLAGAMRMPFIWWSQLVATRPVVLTFQVYKNITFSRFAVYLHRGGAPGKAINAVDDAKSQFGEPKLAARRESISGQHVCLRRCESSNVPPMATPGDHVAAERELIVDVRDGEAQFGDAVSVIMPVLNEERHLREAVGAVLDQDFPGLIEVILALGRSTDNTDSVAADLVAGDSRVRTVSNPSGRTPTALNAALQVATHSIIVRVDGHCELPATTSLAPWKPLIRTGADNVGGVMAAEGTTDFESAVALAMTSKLGVGGAPFHVGGQEGEAQTVYLGVFRAQTLQRVGGYDESFDRAQDWEMNHRIRSLGGKIWFNPQMQVSYRPRPEKSAGPPVLPVRNVAA